MPTRQPIVAPIAAVPAEPATPTNPQPLPLDLYCPDCGICLEEEGMRFEEPIRGSRWGSASISSYDRIEYRTDESDEEAYGDIEHICSNCDEPLPSNLWDRLEFIEDLNLKFSEERWKVPMTAEELARQGFNSGNLRRRKIFLVYNPNQFNETYVFHPEALEVIDHMISEGITFPDFNRQHECYTGISPSSTNPTATAPEIALEDEEPEQHSMVSQNNHQRWNQNVHYPNHSVECINEECNFPFIVDNINDEHTCPKCQHSWDPAEIIEETGTSAFRTNF